MMGFARRAKLSVFCGYTGHERRADAPRRLLVAIAIGVSLLAANGCSAQLRPSARPGMLASVMVASWYGQKYHGRQTASGVVFDMYAMTAAHKTLPFGTRLRVTHRRSQRSVVVEINDRGPFIKGRDLDLSMGAAQALAMVDEGVARVHVERMN